MQYKHGGWRSGLLTSNMGRVAGISLALLGFTVVEGEDPGGHGRRRFLSAACSKFAAFDAPATLFELGLGEGRSAALRGSKELAASF